MYYIAFSYLYLLQTEVIGKVNGIQIYESDLNTLSGKRAINDKVKLLIYNPLYKDTHYNSKILYNGISICT